MYRGFCFLIALKGVFYPSFHTSDLLLVYPKALTISGHKFARRFASILIVQLLVIITLLERSEPPF